MKGLTHVEVLNEQLLVIETHTSLFLYRVADMNVQPDQIEPAVKIKEDLLGKTRAPVAVMRRKDYTLMGFSCDNQAYFYKIPAQL